MAEFTIGAPAGSAPMPADFQPTSGRPYLVTPPPHAVPEGPPQTTHTAQAAIEGVPDGDGDYVEFLGEVFRLADRVGIAPLIHFGFASKKGLDSEDMEGLAAMYSLIRSVIHRPPLLDDNGVQLRDTNGKRLRDEREWQRFWEHAEDELADGDDIMGFVNKAMEIMSARPTKPREDSSASSRTTSETSRPASFSPATVPGADGLTPVSQLGR